MPDTEKSLRRLELSNVLRVPVILNVIDTIKLPPGGKGLDAGCGNGFFALMLAEAVGHSGHVNGLDIEELFLTRGSALASQAELAERISFVRGDVKKFPFKDNAFDWAVSIDPIGYVILQVHPAVLLKQSARVVKSGGMVYILMWSLQIMFLGYPTLEAQLNATTLGVAPFDEKMKPDSHYMHALGWLKQAGLSEAKAQTFVGDINPPISKENSKPW